MNPQQIQQEMKSEQDKLNLLTARMSDTEKGNLFLFCQNPKMVHAVEKVMLYALYQMGTMTKEDGNMADVDVNFAYGIGYNTNTTDEQVGKALRVKIEALSLLEDAFKQIKKFGVEKADQSIEKNPAV